jgi:hypothetical protein
MVRMQDSYLLYWGVQISRAQKMLDAELDAQMAAVSLSQDDLLPVGTCGLVGGRSAPNRRCMFANVVGYVAAHGFLPRAIPRRQDRTRRQAAASATGLASASELDPQMAAPSLSQAGLSPVGLLRVRGWAVWSLPVAPWLPA